MRFVCFSCSPCAPANGTAMSAANAAVVAAVSFLSSYHTDTETVMQSNSEYNPIKINFVVICMRIQWNYRHSNIIISFVWFFLSLFFVLVQAKEICTNVNGIS